ncbi:asparaginyl-tRNA synthetase [Grosmannia clavigera kw1407]|uniref:asparagine--tRNA ligase n=1 Tax=Grosmannia clavigera (strain kw1407 / UAMH 11150) TaxID=655863 RepID=F0XH04_GROCL|nr:asparaginyl-tRNA synthetase [Grosmannia clavigera kw1407]EFX02730.1 asparaginyl-tRNA synthetase [Grosmannia clavigera kw1407]
MATTQEPAVRVAKMEAPAVDKVYVDTDVGIDDETADGTEAKPYKSLAYAYIQNIDKTGKEYLMRASTTTTAGGDAADEAMRLQWKAPAKSTAKKAQTLLDGHKKKLAKLQQTQAKEEEQRQQRAKNLEAAKLVKLSEDTTLPAAKTIKLWQKDVPLGEAAKGSKGTRVRVFGRIHRLRAQKQATFLTLKDGYGYLQCVLAAGPLTQTYEALLFAQETSLWVYGELRTVPEGATAPDGRELHVDFFEVFGRAPGDAEAITNIVATGQQDPWEADMLDKRHLVLRGDKASAVMKLRSILYESFVLAYRQRRIAAVSPPAFVQTQVEGGSTLFRVPYYSEDAYLTQSSQLYLETCLPSLGDVYCIEKSFRAEKSLTRRHLAEYTHIEAELDGIVFEDLLTHVEDMICAVVDAVLADPAGRELVQLLNPGFVKPARPFRRMRYADAIDWLNAQDPPVPNEFGQPHVFGDDIAEAAERKMVDTLNVPVLLTHFPVEVKAFYMKKDPADLRVTESVDVLMPTVGEIVGGSMRMEGYEELLAAFKNKGLNPEPYYWYLDQRKYGTSPHGGYGLGLERFLAWIANQHTVRTCCLYPRFMGRAKP